MRGDGEKRKGEKGRRRSDDTVVVPKIIVFTWVVRQATRGKL